ncbi:MAG: hypothetical protein ACXWAV_07930, partial [Chthoniobacterales bacterium]
HANSHVALSALAILFAVGPATGHLISAAFIWRFPLNEQRHAELRTALDEQERAQLFARTIFSDSGRNQTAGRPGPGSVIPQTIT